MRFLIDGFEQFAPIERVSWSSSIYLVGAIRCSATKIKAYRAMIGSHDF